jgi:hypothetical protein
MARALKGPPAASAFIPLMVENGVGWGMMITLLINGRKV